jgi:6-phosphogluconate dehydrogenase
MVSTLCEVWFIMSHCLGMEYEEIGKSFEEWNKSGPLVSVSAAVCCASLARVQYHYFFVSIGVDICRTKDPKTRGYVLATVRDKVVQYVDDEEGTGTWSCEEGARLHVPIPTIAAAHLFRLASADAARRIAVNKSFSGGAKVGSVELQTPPEEALKSFVEDFHMAIYASFLMAIAQGLHLIKKVDKEHWWGLGLHFGHAAVARRLHHPVRLHRRSAREGLLLEHDDDDLLGSKEIGNELSKAFPSLKVILKAVEAYANITSLSASLEYYKYSSSTDLPTQFMEAELDYFGGHMNDLKSAKPGKPVKGRHPFEWMPAKGIFEDFKEKP